MIKCKTIEQVVDNVVKTEGLNVWVKRNDPIFRLEHDVLWIVFRVTGVELRFDSGIKEYDRFNTVSVWISEDVVVEPKEIAEAISRTKLTDKGFTLDMFNEAEPSEHLARLVNGRWVR